MIGIYKIENLINHKKYIGKANNINKRFGEHKRLAFYPTEPSYNYPLYKAIRKYGLNNFDFSIIEECKESELNEKEKYWIDFYNTYKGEGYNQTPGGDGSPKVSVETVVKLYKSGYSILDICDYFNASKNTIIEILHANNLGYMSQEDKNKLQNPKPVFQYDLNGNFIAEYYSAGEAARQLSGNHNPNSILKVCNGEANVAYNFLWKYKNDDKDMKQIAKQISQKEKARIEHVSKAILKRCSKPVNQYNLNGEYIKTYPSAAEARRAVKNQHICDVCNGKWITAANYYWRYVSQDFPEKQDLNTKEIDEWRKRIKQPKTNGGEG